MADELLRVLFCCTDLLLFELLEGRTLGVFLCCAGLFTVLFAGRLLPDTRFLFTAGRCVLPIAGAGVLFLFIVFTAGLWSGLEFTGAGRFTFCEGVAVDGRTRFCCVLWDT